ncbi:MAG: HDOD domain-containing protein [Gammaproteobacteria bacterium]|nr:HDOD domain-containing protein [Gammaproteobacteria bacterium]
MNAVPKCTAKYLHKWLERHKSLPSFPSVLTELDAVLASEAVTLEAVVAVLQADVSVVARIMKTVNSARYIMHEPAQTLTDAVSRLGFSATRMVAIAAAFMSLMDTPKSFSLRDFWRSAFVSAVACREVVGMARLNHENLDPSSAFTLGVASDLGVFLLDACCADDYAAIVQKMQSNPLALVKMEQQVLGVDHAIASAILLRSWRFPESWVMGVAGHYFPARLPKAQQPWADALLIAESVGYYLGYGHGVCPSSPTGMSLELTQLRLGSLGLTERDFMHLASRVALMVEQEGWLSLADDVSG